MLNILIKNKKIIISIIIILLIPIIMPLIEVLFKIVITFGRYIGTNIRLIEEGICVK